MPASAIASGTYTSIGYSWRLGPGHFGLCRQGRTKEKEKGGKGLKGTVHHLQKSRKSRVLEGLRGELKPGSEAINNNGSAGETL